MLGLGIFCLDFKTIASIWNPHSGICLMAKFHITAEMLELQTKNALFDILDQKCLLCVFLV